MTPETRGWLDGLRDHAAGLGPVDPRENRPSAEIAAERALITATLSVWLDTELSGLMTERAMEAARVGTGGLRSIDPEPAIVITTTRAGVAAALALLDREEHPMWRLRERFACVTELEYRRFCIRHPDDDHRLHVVHWSWMKTRVPPQWRPRFEPWPIGVDECYWLHRTGTAGAGEERRASHLWKWNGATASLLKAFVREGRGDA